MLYTRPILFYSLLATLVSISSDSLAAVRINSKSRANAASNEQVQTIRNPGPAVAMQNTQQVSTSVEQVSEPEPSELELPIRVADRLLGLKIANGQEAPVTMENLENCGAIYPNGEFEWNSPTVGSKRAAGDQCVSIVEMRAYQQGTDGEDLVVARVRLGAGDSIKCNISEWPEGSYLKAAEQIEFPADSEPTLADVEAQMNQEQKQNAGIKIAAGTVLAAVAGNAMGKSAPGSEKMLGTNKDKLESTAIGAAAGAALMAGSVYGGKVAGDMIMSATVNAAAGGVIGNMAASGSSVLRVEPCYAKKSTLNKEAGNATNKDSGNQDKNSADQELCLWGVYRETKDLSCATEDVHCYYNIQDHTYRVCKKQKDQDGKIISPCEIKRLANPVMKDNEDNKVELYKADEKKHITAWDAAENDLFRSLKISYKLNKLTNEMEPAGTPDATGENVYIELSSASEVTSETPAMVKLGNKSIPAFGFKKSDWDEVSKTGGASATDNKGAKKNKLELIKNDMTVYRRGIDGSPSGDIENSDIKNFVPSEQSAESGGLLDLDNKARLKGTLIGAGSGAAMGAFSAYQGAKSDIQIRWEQEVRTYKDSLTKVYCGTGKRFLSSYNDDVYIPAPRE